MLLAGFLRSSDRPQNECERLADAWFGKLRERAAQGSLTLGEVRELDDAGHEEAKKLMRALGMLGIRPRSAIYTVVEDGLRDLMRARGMAFVHLARTGTVSEDLHADATKAVESIAAALSVHFPADDRRESMRCASNGLHVFLKEVDAKADVIADAAMEAQLGGAKGPVPRC